MFLESVETNMEEQKTWKIRTFVYYVSPKYSEDGMGMTKELEGLMTGEWMQLGKVAANGEIINSWERKPGQK